MDRAVAVRGAMSLLGSRPLVAKVVATIHMSPNMSAPSLLAANCAMGLALTLVVLASVLGTGSSCSAGWGSCLSSASGATSLALACTRVFEDTVFPPDFEETVLLTGLPADQSLREQTQLCGPSQLEHVYMSRQRGESVRCRRAFGYQSCPTVSSWLLSRAVAPGATGLGLRGGRSRSAYVTDSSLECLSLLWRVSAAFTLVMTWWNACLCVCICGTEAIVIDAPQRHDQFPRFRPLKPENVLIVSMRSPSEVHDLDTAVTQHGIGENLGTDEQWQDARRLLTDAVVLRSLFECVVRLARVVYSRVATSVSRPPDNCKAQSNVST